jgi:hypothetical protein
MTIQLTKEEKAQIITSHIRSVSYSRYNLEVDTIQENAKSSPSAAVIASINTQIAELDDQILALNTELTAVNALVE